MPGVMEQYECGIAGCLFCDLGLKCSNADLNDTEFHSRFLEHVIVPLEESWGPFASSFNPHVKVPTAILLSHMLFIYSDIFFGSFCTAQLAAYIIN